MALQSAKLCGASMLWLTFERHRRGGKQFKSQTFKYCIGWGVEEWCPMHLKKTGASLRKLAPGVASLLTQSQFARIQQYDVRAKAEQIDYADMLLALALTDIRLTDSEVVCRELCAIS